MPRSRSRSISPRRRSSPRPRRTDSPSRHRSRSPKFNRTPSPLYTRRDYSPNARNDRRRRYYSPRRSRSRSYSRSPPRRRRRYRSRSRSFDRDRYRPSEFVILAPIGLDTTELELQTLLSNLSNSHNTALAVLRDKQTGISRQAALIRFPRLENARRFVHEHIDSGIYIGTCQARPSFPRPNQNDWDCLECNYLNFWHTFMCSKCGCAMDIDVSELVKEVSQPWAADGSGDVSDLPTSTLILRGLNSLATEQTIHDTLKQLADALQKPWVPIQVRLIRSKANNSSLGFGFVEYESSEIAIEVYAILTNKSLYPSGFYILSKAATVDYAISSTFTTAYATSAFTVVVPRSLRIIAYHNPSAYAVGYPVPDVEVADLQQMEEDPLAAFYAEIDEPSINESEKINKSHAIPEQDTVPAYDLIYVPPYEDFIDRTRKLCCLCRLVFPSAKHALQHSLKSELHLTRLQNDTLAQQVAMIIKYRYKHPPVAKKKHAQSLESGIGGQLLAKLGWTGGGLGRQNDGITQAIEATSYTPGAGIGAGFAMGLEHFGSASGPGAHALDITRKRFWG